MPNEDSQELRFLVADPNDELFDALKGEHDALGEVSTERAPKPVHASSVREVQSFLTDRDFAYAAVLIEPELGSAAWLGAIKSSHQFRPGVPVFIVYAKPPKISPEQSKKLGVQGWLKRPVTYKAIQELVLGEDETPEPDLKVEEDAAAVASGLTDADFVEIDVGQSGFGNSRVMFDLYAKLSNGKFTKILNSGEVLSKARITSLAEQGFKKLYVTLASHVEYMNFCDELVSMILKDSSASAEDKTSHVTSQGQNTMTFLRVAGFSEESMERAQKYVANVTEMVQQVALQTPAVKEWMNNVASYEHGVACTTIAGLMMKNIGAQSAVVYNAIGMASLLHDISLLGQPDIVVDEEPDKMTEEQKKIFYEHPILSAKQLSKMKSVPPVVAQAVEQHHLRINKQGFPVNKQVAMPNLIAEVVGICEEFIHLMKRAKQEPTLDPIKVLVEMAPQQFSQKIVGPFLRTIKDK